jgi:hypothetical protein
MALETQRSRLKSNGKVNDMGGQITNRRVGGVGGNKLAAISNVTSSTRAITSNASSTADGPLSTLTPGNMMEMQYYNPSAAGGATGLLPVGIPSGGGGGGNRRSKWSRGSSVEVSDQQPAVVCGRSGLYVDFTV